MSTEYVVLCGQIVGGGDRPFETVYGFDGQRFRERRAAISHGFTKRRSDDFNIGVIKDGRLISLDWMEKPVDTAPEVLCPIAEQVGFRAPTPPLPDTVRK